MFFFLTVNIWESLGVCVCAYVCQGLRLWSRLPPKIGSQFSMLRLQLFCWGVAELEMLGNKNNVTVTVTWCLSNRHETRFWSVLDTSSNHPISDFTSIPICCGFNFIYAGPQRGVPVGYLNGSVHQVWNSPSTISRWSSSSKWTWELSLDFCQGEGQPAPHLDETLVRMA